MSVFIQFRVKEDGTATLSDCTLALPYPETTPLPSHRILLSAHSQSLAENFTKADATAEFTLPELPSLNVDSYRAALNLVLDWLYGQVLDLPALPPSSLLNLHALASALNLTVLATESGNALTAAVDKDPAAALAVVCGRALLPQSELPTLALTRVKEGFGILASRGLPSLDPLLNLPGAEVLDVLKEAKIDTEEQRFLAASGYLRRHMKREKKVLKLELVGLMPGGAPLGAKPAAGWVFEANSFDGDEADPCSQFSVKSDPIESLNLSSAPVALSLPFAVPAAPEGVTGRVSLNGKRWNINPDWFKAAVADPVDATLKMAGSGDLKLKWSVAAYEEPAAPAKEGEAAPPAEGAPAETAPAEEDVAAQFAESVCWNALTHATLKSAAKMNVWVGARLKIVDALSFKLDDIEAHGSPVPSAVPAAATPARTPARTPAPAVTPARVFPPTPKPEEVKTRPSSVETEDDWWKFPRKFNFSSDGDQAGVLFFFGTKGGSAMYRNPHNLGSVKAIASSVGFGSVESIVGRAPAQLRTENRPDSWLGVQFLHGGRFELDGYWLKNRQATTHCLSSWDLEGSLTESGEDWTLLDSRRNDLSLRASGACAFFDITRKGVGCVRFRIIQRGLNSSSGNNLCLSNMELYGTLHPQ